MATWFPSNQRGKGHPHIMCPMEKYISASRKTTDDASRLLSLGVSWSARASSRAAGEALCPAPFTLAP